MDKSGESVSLRQLRALVAVADTASFTRAAETLSLSQPSISHLIRRLEDEVGQALVVRGRDVSLTQAGQALADISRQAIFTIDSALASCQGTAALKAGSVIVAVGHVSAATLMPSFLKAFHHRHPNIDIQVIDCTVQEIKTKLTTHEADIGLGAVFQNDDSQLMTEVVSDAGISLYIKRDHPLAQRDYVEARVLQELPCIQLNPQAPAWLSIHQTLMSAGIQVRVEQRVTLLSTVIGLIQAGMGAAILPTIAASQMPPDIARVIIRNPSLQWPIAIVRLVNYPLTPAAQAFVTVVRETTVELRQRALQPWPLSLP